MLHGSLLVGRATRRVNNAILEPRVLTQLSDGSQFPMLDAAPLVSENVERSSRLALESRLEEMDSGVYFCSRLSAYLKNQAVSCALI